MLQQIGFTIGRSSRAESCPDDEINVVHGVHRCVWRGLLYGDDPVTGKHYEHRPEWIRQRIEFLAGKMVGVEVLRIRDSFQSFPCRVT